MLRWVEADCVFMPANNIDGVAGDAHAWAGNAARVDRIPHGNVCALGAFGPHVAFGGEASEHVSFGSRSR
jgi:hypothetical protein